MTPESGWSKSLFRLDVMRDKIGQSDKGEDEAETEAGGHEAEEQPGPELLIDEAHEDRTDNPGQAPG